MRPESRVGGNGGTDGHPAIQEFLATIDRVRAESAMCDGYDLQEHVESMRSLRVRVELVCERRAEARRRRKEQAEPAP